MFVPSPISVSRVHGQPSTVCPRDCLLKTCHLRRPLQMCLLLLCSALARCYQRIRLRCCGSRSWQLSAYHHGVNSSEYQCQVLFADFVKDYLYWPKYLDMFLPGRGFFWFMLTRALCFRAHPNLMFSLQDWIFPVNCKRFLELTWQCIFFSCLFLIDVFQD